MEKYVKGTNKMLATVEICNWKEHIISTWFVAEILFTFFSCVVRERGVQGSRAHVASACGTVNTMNAPAGNKGTLDIYRSMFSIGHFMAHFIGQLPRCVIFFLLISQNLPVPTFDIKIFK